ncbi:MAG: 16S rRNA (cytosine(1402)-N(4))-methyltransferase RsmH [Dehalococcoidia bacterium]|nr:16S rRNA (cytosine(1402)-N(4))-methyltransferase RsmH [Dehalococcoidia bacterium]
MDRQETVSGFGQQHIPVMVSESIQGLNVRADGRYVDCTAGAGGHTLAILRAGASVRVLSIDKDSTVNDIYKEAVKGYEKRVELVKADFSELKKVATDAGFAPVAGVLFDLGVSSMQLDEASRGFSFQSEGPLDMRMDPAQKISASDIINRYEQKELAAIIYKYGEDSAGNRIASAIVRARPITTTAQLASVVSIAKGGRRGARIHPATQTFQAIRIAVNDELQKLSDALKQAIDLLAPQGRLAVISYHSLEDRIVKQFMKTEQRNCICPPGLPECRCGHKAALKIIKPDFITPSEQELTLNPRSRSAKLRVAERIAQAA